MAKKRKKTKKSTIKIPIQSTKQSHEKKPLSKQTKIILIVLLAIAFLLLIVLIFSNDPTYKPKSTQTTIVSERGNTRTLQSNTQTFPSNGSFCLKGERIHFEGANSKADVTVIGTEFFENNYFCKAQDTKKLPSEVGEVTVKTEYYFESTGREVWFITTTTGNGFPPQVTTLHMIDGKIIAQ